MTTLQLYGKYFHYRMNVTLAHLYGYGGRGCIKSILATPCAVPICITLELERMGTRRNLEVERNTKKKNMKDEQSLFASPFLFLKFLSGIEKVVFNSVIQPTKTQFNNLLDFLFRQKSLNRSNLTSEESDLHSAIQCLSKALKIRGIYRPLFQTKSLTQPLTLIGGDS